MDKIAFNLAGLEGEIDVIIEFKEIDVSVLGGPDIKITGQSDTLPYVYAKVKDRDALKNLARNERIVKIWRDEPVNAFSYLSCYYNPLLNDVVPLQGIDRIWDEGYTGEGIVIGVADTGVDDTHPDFTGRTIKKAHTIGDTDVDGHGHGTHVMSCAGGNGDVYKGIAPEADFVSVKVLNDGGNGSQSSVMNGVNWLMNDEYNNVDIINLSLGSSMIITDGSDPLSQTCALAIRKGKIVVVAAGNNGPKTGSIAVPACREEIIAVGASDKSDKLVFFSGRGPTTDDRIKPDITAVGKDVVGARAKGTSMGTPINQYYTKASGTSFASPIVSGLCALLLQKNNKLNQYDIKNILMGTAKKIEV